MEDRHVLYLEIVVHKTEIKTLFVDEDSNNWSQGNMKFLSLMHFDKSVSKTTAQSCVRVLCVGDTVYKASQQLPGVGGWE